MNRNHRLTYGHDYDMVTTIRFVMMKLIWKGLRNMKKAFTMLLLSMMVTVIMLAGCAKGGASGGSAVAKDSLVIGINADATSMDPLRISDTVTMSLLSNVYETLVRMNPDSKIIPAAAESWKISDDGLEYVFYLRSGMTFHNGSPITAEDVKYSIEQAVKSSYSGSYLAFIDHVEVVDKSSVKVVLQYAYAPFLSLCATYTNIVSEAFYTDGGTKQSKEPIGSGPYKFVSWANGDKIVLEAYEGYFDKQPAIKNLTYKILTNTTTATIALEKGEIDMYINVAPADIGTLESNKNIVVDQKPSSAFYFLGLNTESKVFSDIRVRQAVAKAIDREALIYGVMDGAAKATTTFIAKGRPGYAEGFDPLPYDVEGAKALLAEAGHADGLNITMSVPESRSEHAQMIQADLKKIGINVKIALLESGAFWDDMENGDYEMMMMGWSYVVMDPDVGYYSLYKSDEIIAGNYVRLSNARLDELMELGRVSSDANKRNAIYGEAEKIAMTEAAYVPLYWRNTIVAYDKGLQNVKIPPCGFYFIYDYYWGK